MREIKDSWKNPSPIGSWFEVVFSESLAKRKRDPIHSETTLFLFMNEYFHSHLEPLTWFAIQAFWLVIAIIGMVQLGGKGSLLLLLGTIGGFSSQMLWTADSLFSGLMSQSVIEYLGGYGSWADVTVAIIGLASYILMGVGFLLVIQKSAGRKREIAEMKLMLESTPR